jgi:hypothetical protein
METFGTGVWKEIEAVGRKLKEMERPAAEPALPLTTV